MPILVSVCQYSSDILKYVSDLATGRWFSPGTLVFSTNTSDHHDITEFFFESGVKHYNSDKMSSSS